MQQRPITITAHIYIYLPLGAVALNFGAIIITPSLKIRTRSLVKIDFHTQTHVCVCVGVCEVVWVSQESDVRLHEGREFVCNQTICANQIENTTTAR